MELKSKLSTFILIIKKYKYAMIVLIVGLILMLLPTGEKNLSYETVEITQTNELEPTLEERLTQILSSVEGIGDIQIVLTVAEGEQIVYQTDSSSNQSNTVTITNASREETGLIRQINPGKYLGAIIVCHGGDNPSVRLAVVDAVSKATGLGANQISVLKMK